MNTEELEQKYIELDARVTKIENGIKYQQNNIKKNLKVLSEIIEMSKSNQESLTQQSFSVLES